MLPEEIADARQRRYNGTVAWLRKPNPDLMIMRVRPDFPRPPHRAGQYCSLGLGYWEPRVPGCQEEDAEARGRGQARPPGVLDQLLDPRRRRRAARPRPDRLAGVLHRAGPREVRPGQAAGPDAAAVHAPRGRPAQHRREDHRALHARARQAGRHGRCSSAPAPARPRTTTCLGAAHDAGTRARSCTPAASATSATSATCDTHRPLMRRFPNYQYLALTTREADTVGQKVYIQDLITSGELEERPRRAARPGADARVPVRQPEDDRRAGQEQGDRGPRVPAAARA